MQISVILKTSKPKMDLKIIEKEYGWKLSEGDYIRKKPESKMKRFIKALKVSLSSKISRTIKYIY